jgi:ArsR family transcriptional regulator
VNRSKNLERSADRARLFAALGDPARLAILDRLRGGTRCLCELREDLGMAPPLLSYHMRVLREAGFVSGKRRGRRIDYRLEPKSFDLMRRELGAFEEARR